MNAHGGLKLAVVVLGVAAAMFGSAAVGGQEPKTKVEDLSEAQLIKMIRALSEPGQSELSPAEEKVLQRGHRMELLAVLNELLDRFPQTEFRTRALTLKLRTLGTLARVDLRFWKMLDELTQELAREKPTGELAAARDFAALEVFVIGARLEKMPEQQRLRGTFERYQAFLEDHPDSELVPVIWASLIRNALVLGDRERAQKELEAFGQRFPEHPAYRRAAGEVAFAGRLGLPYDLKFQAVDGSEVDTGDFAGKVQVVYFWISSDPGVEQLLAQLAQLDREYYEQGLRLVGVCADLQRARMDQLVKQIPLRGPHFYDGKGFQNALVVAGGITSFPTILVVDRGGILRYVNPEEKLEDIVKALLAEPATP